MVHIVLFMSCVLPSVFQIYVYALGKSLVCSADFGLHPEEVGDS